MKPDAKHSDLSEADLALEAFLAPARSAPAPSDDLMARILGDAAKVSADRLGPVLTAPDPAPRRGLIATLIAAIGGWPVLGGMATATMAGVWLGFSSPALLDQTGFTDPAYSLSDLMPSFELAMADLDWTE